MYTVYDIDVESNQVYYLASDADREDAIDHAKHYAEDNLASVIVCDDENKIVYHCNG
jgi:hypothetical protein